MTLKEAERRLHMFAALERLGFSRQEAESLRRISLQLHSWNERLCNDCEENEDGTASQYNSMTGKRWPIRNQGKGATARLAKLMQSHPTLIAYEQGDPRGVALYIVEKSKLKPGQAVDAYYSTYGIPVY